MTNTSVLRRQARECAVQFLYQSEREKTYYFQESGFSEFCDNFHVDSGSKEYARELAKGTLDHQEEIDQLITGVSENWSIARFGSTDRCVLRIAVYELMQKQVPPKVVLNEAIDIAKQYGTEHSGRFVNGLLDKISRSLRADG